MIEKSLSDKIHQHPYEYDEESIYLNVKDVKEFIKKQTKRIANRISTLSEFDVPGETILQKAELGIVLSNLHKDAGPKLT